MITKEFEVLRSDSELSKPIQSFTRFIHLLALHSLRLEHGCIVNAMPTFTLSGTLFLNALIVFDPDLCSLNLEQEFNVQVSCPFVFYTNLE